MMAELMAALDDASSGHRIVSRYLRQTSNLTPRETDARRSSISRWASGARRKEQLLCLLPLRAVR